MASKKDLESYFELLDAKGDLSLAERIEILSSQFLGCSYDLQALTQEGEEETLKVSLTSFDCVTFCELVLALSLSHSLEEFEERLKGIRYSSDDISWQARKHYMTDWVSDNLARGYLEDCLSDMNCIEIERELSLLSSFPAKQCTLKFLPREEFLSRLENFSTGDIVFFGTSRDNLDVSHLGFLISQNGNWILRHASKEKDAVVDEKLEDFFKRFGETPGVWVFRPVEKENA